MEKLFSEVGKIIRKSRVIQSESLKRGERFNVFAVVGVDHYELKHSAFIAELLNPEGSHGQRTSFLSIFLKICCPADFMFSLQGVKVYVEYVTKSGRIDILVTNNDKQAIIIENKIYAPDGNEQLKRYDDEALKRYTNGYRILYLTRKGDDASPESSKGIAYYKISYQKEILKWLKECIIQCVSLPLIRETLIQYSNHIKRLTNIDMEKEEKERLFATMAENAEQVRAIQSISWLEYLEFVFKKYVRPKLEKIEGLIYEEKNMFGDSGERGFYFRRKGWNHSAIWIYTDRSKPVCFRIGISNYSGGPLNVGLNKLDCLKKQSDKDWPYGWESLGKYTDWFLQSDTIPDMIDDDKGNNKFVEYIKAKVKEILEEIDNKKIEMP